MRKKGKSQSRSKSIVALMLVLLLLVTALIFTFITFSYGEDVKIYRGTFGAIEKGVDINGGFYTVIEPWLENDIEENKIGENIKESAKVIESRLLASGHAGATAIVQTASNGDKSIRIEIPKNDSIKSVSNADSAINTAVVQGVLEFKIEGEDEAFLTNSDFKKFSVHQATGMIGAPTSYGVLLELTNDGFKKYTDKIEDSIGKKMGINLDGQALTSYDIESEATSSPFLTIGENLEQANSLATLFNYGVNPVKFKSFETKELSAVLGDKTLTTLLIACIIGVLLVLTVMIILYKGFGLSAALSTLLYIVVLLFILSQLPVVLSLAGFIAIILSIGIFAGANITIFENIKEEYALGRSFKTSVSNGFKRAAAAVIDFSVVTFILAIMLLIFGGAATNFAIILTIGIILSISLCYTVTRLFVKLLLPINNKPKFYGLKRGVIEDEE